MLDFIGKMRERSNRAVSKTVEPQGSGGSNPPLSVIFRTLLMSPGAMQEVIIQPRQVRKKAAADS